MTLMQQADALVAARTVLVVEDDPDFQLLTRTALEAAGFHVEMTPNLHDTLDLLSISAGVFEAVVLDLDLPDQQGADTLELVRSVSHAPLIVYSSSPQRRLDQMVALGADAAVSKVDDRDRLVAVIDETIERVARGLLTAPAASTDLEADGDFLAIAETVIDHLRATCGVSTWMVTRVVDQDWTILAVHDPNYGVQAGDTLRWDDSFCSRMVKGRARVVADTAVDLTYDDAPIGKQIDIGCYVGYPLIADRDALFGTLCGIQPEGHANPARLAEQEVTLEAFARILGSSITLDLERDRLQRRLQAAEQAARQDRLTGLGNRRAWERALRMEEARCVRFGHHAGIAIVDLDGLKTVNDVHGHAAGDALIRRAGAILEQSLRQIDQVFRIGGDEFAVLLPEASERGLMPVQQRLERALSEAGVAASVGVALRGSANTFADAVAEADARMYARKRASA